MDYLARLIVAVVMLSGFAPGAFAAVVSKSGSWAGNLKVQGPSGVVREIARPGPISFGSDGTVLVGSRSVAVDLEGAAEFAVSEAGTITAVDLAKAAVGLVRGGLVPLAVSALLPVIMDAAKVAWDGSHFTEPGSAAVGDPSQGYYPIVGQGTAGVNQPYDICKADEPDVVVWQDGSTYFVVKEIGSSSPYSGSAYFNCPSGSQWKSGARAWYKDVNNSTACSVGVYDNNTHSCSVAPQVVVDDDTAANDMAPSIGGNAPGLAGDVYNDGGNMASSDPSASAPSVVPGPSSTSTTSTDAGTTTSTTTTNYNITTEGDTVTVTPTTTVVTTTPDGKQSTTTTTQNPAVSGGQSPPSTPADQKVNCDVYPNSSGCDELGTPDDIPMPSQSVNVALSPTMSAAGSCPAPISLPIMGKTYSLSWEPVCEFATGIRPIVVALAWLSAGFFIFMIARG